MEIRVSVPRVRRLLVNLIFARQKTTSGREGLSLASIRGEAIVIRLLTCDLNIFD